jgi:hypothetical protein
MILKPATNETLTLNIYTVPDGDVVKIDTGKSYLIYDGKNFFVATPKEEIIGNGKDFFVANLDKIIGDAYWDVFMGPCVPIRPGHKFMPLPNALPIEEE